MKWISKLLFWWESRPLRLRLSKLEQDLKFNRTGAVRVYYARTGPARARLRSALRQALALPPAQRSRFIVHLMAEWYSLSAYFPLWMERACQLDLFPYNSSSLAYYTGQTNDRVRKNLQLVRVLIDRFNKVHHTAYTEKDFTNHPLSPGVKDFINLCQQELDNATQLIREPRALPESEWIEPFEVLHFELEFMSLETELKIVQNQIGETMEDVVVSIDGTLSTLGLGHWQWSFLSLSAQPEVLCEVGIQGLDCLTQIIQTAHERSQ